MSKSDLSDYSRIMLCDTNDEIIQKIKKAKTDPHPLPSNLQDLNKRPEALNLFSIFASLNNLSTEEVVQNYAGKEFSIFKNDLGELIVEKIGPIREEIKKLLADKAYLDNVLKDGKEKATVVADSVLKDIYDVIGFAKP